MTGSNRVHSIELTKADLTMWDYIVLSTYFVLIVAVGTAATFKNRGSLGGYFLGGCNLPGWIVASSLFSSNIGPGHFVGLAGTAANSGIAVTVFELHAVYTLAMLGWLFLPVYRATGVYTLPEYMHKRYGGMRIRVYLAVMSLMLYVATKISADLYSGALFMEQAVPGTTSLYVWVSVLVVVAAVFTITGGLTAVMWTDTIQTVIMVVGAFMLMVLAFEKVGGYEEMKRKYPLALADTAILGSVNGTKYQFIDCGRPIEGWFTMMRPVDDPELPWTGLVFGLTVSAVWYWCTDQVIVQRALAAKNMIHGKMGCVMASYLKLLPMWLIVMPGMISRILYPDDIACNEDRLCEKICHRRKGCHDIAYPLLVVRLMPDGMRGLMLAVMMSALISSLTSVFNSTSTIFTIDVWQRFRRRASDVELMLVGRLSVVFLIVVSIVWIPIVKNANQLFEYIQQMTSFLGAPVCAAFVLAVFWKRSTESGVFWGMILGTVVGLCRGAWSVFFIASKPCGYKAEVKSTDFLVTKVNYLHFGALNYVFTTLVIMLWSYATKAPEPETYTGKTFFTRGISFLEEKSPEEEAEKDTAPSYFRNLLAEKKTLAEQPFHVRALLWVCGVEDMINTKEATVKAQMNRSIYEETKMAYIMHANMGMALVFITGYWAFYSL